MIETPIVSQKKRFSEISLSHQSPDEQYFRAVSYLLRLLRTRGWDLFARDSQGDKLFEFFIHARVPAQFKMADVSIPRDVYRALASQITDDTGSVLPLSPYMVLTVKTEKWIANAWNLASWQDLSLFVRWLFYSNRFAQFGALPAVRDELLAWAQEPVGASAATASSVSRLEYLLWVARPDLQSQFDIHSQRGCAGLREWCSRHAVAEFELSADFASCFSTGLFKSIARKLAEGLSSNLSSATPAVYATSEPGTTDGVCVIGTFGGEFGVGQHARAVVSAFDATGALPFTLLNAAMGPHDQSNATYRDRYVSENRHAINLHCINVMSVLDALGAVGARNVIGRYNIGYGYWELPTCPREWQPFIELFDEFWAPTKFIADALAASTNVPVIHMPIPVEVKRPAIADRAQFGLPADKFLFLFHFDAYSFAQRKNPKAAIDAFRRAFPRGGEPACLVIKSKHLPANLTAQLQSATAGDDRVIFLEGEFTREQIITLEATSDAYVSLHRSEGFGMGPAEMMCLGKPVIVTNYSGNTDFTLETTACLVDYSLVPVQPGEYAYYEPGQVWAQPDVDHAAYFMRKVFEDRQFAMQIGAAAQDFMNANYNAVVIGQRYLRRLKEIGETLRSF